MSFAADTELLTRSHDRGQGVDPKPERRISPRATPEVNRTGFRRPRMLTAMRHKAGFASISLALAVTLASACVEHFPSYQVWIENSSEAEVLIVLTDQPEGTSTLPTYVVSPHRILRVTPAVLTYGLENDENAADVLIYDANCALFSKVEVTAGAYRIDIGQAVDVQRVEDRSEGPSGSPELRASTTQCPGAAPIDLEE